MLQTTAKRAGGLTAPIREKLSGISENRISSAPGCASVERIHLYSIDAALADRADSDTAVGRNISASYGRGALGFTMHNSALSALSLGTISRPIPSGRPLKFTPERIQQIKNLVERDLLLSPDKIGILALEAELRSMSISAFISELITSTVKNDLFRQVLDTEITGRTPVGQPTT